MRRIFNLGSLLLCFTLAAYAQQSQKPDKTKYALVPPELAQLAIASQPGSPLQLENARILLNLETKRFDYGFEFRNRGTKPIVAFAVDRWSIAGGGGTLAPWEAEDQILLPDQVVKYTEQENQRIVPLTDKVRDEFKLRGKLKGVQILIVRWVVFADGTSYRADKTSASLSDYLSALDDEDVPKDPEK